MKTQLTAEAKTIGKGKQAKQVTVITGPPRPLTVEEQLAELRRRVEALESARK